MSSAQYIELPFPPSGNRYYRKVGHRMLLSKSGRDYKIAVENVWKSNGCQLLAGAVWLSVVLTPPDKRRRDLDNFAGKALLDSLKGLAYLDDSQVERLHAEWARGPGGRLVSSPGSAAIALRSM